MFHPVLIIQTIFSQSYMGSKNFKIVGPPCNAFIKDENNFTEFFTVKVGGFT